MTAAQDLFWLAHYAYNTINPLAEEAKAFEPSIQLGVDMIFGHDGAAYTTVHRVMVGIHWGRDGMFANSGRICSKADADKFAEMLQAKVDTLKAEAQQQEILALLEPVSL